MTTGLAYATESSIKGDLVMFLILKMSLLLLLHYRSLKSNGWIQDAYKQMMMDELRALESDITIEENGWSDKSTTQQKEKKTDFMNSILMMINQKKMI